MRYSNTTIDRVREADIVKTIESYCELKKEGANYKCKSPFTEEKTPSFIVSPTKQMFKCFSSGLGGDGLKFVMLHESCEFLEAVEKIAGIHNIYLEKEELTPEVQRQIDRKTEMYNLLDKVARKYIASRKELEQNHWAIKMIYDREFNQDSLIDFAIGFAPEQNKLTKWSINNGLLTIAKELGLCKTKNNHSYDAFKNRLIFPIHNHKGTVVGFGGRRSNAEADSKYAKYLNSPESLVYNKSAVLYGLFQAKKSITKTGVAILTEGYTDVISMHQNGCTNTIAASGTGLSDAQAALIKKYANEIILLRDGDAAGTKAIIRDIDICLANGLSVSLCILPDGEDPDTFARAKQDQMPTWLAANKTDALIWKVKQYNLTRDNYQTDVEQINTLAKQNIEAYLNDIISDDDLNQLDGQQLREAKAFNKEQREIIATEKKEAKAEIAALQKIDPNKKSEAVKNIAQTLFSIKHEVKRNEYIKQIAKLLNVTVGTLKLDIGQLEKAATDKKQKQLGVPAMQNVKLPAGADQEEFMQHGFVTIGNTYQFQRKSGGFFQGTNFKFQPLFHIQGDKENKRLCEIVNVQNKKKLIDFDSGMLANFSEFRKYLFNIGGFRFLTHNGVRTEHFDEFVNRYDDQFEPALELFTMGWNKKGFFAFADGVFWEGKFRKVNKYGIIQLEGIDTTKSEYNQTIDCYYSPAFSVMYADNQEGDDKYENDRYFTYKEATITLNDWMHQMLTVFNTKGIVGTLFNFAAMYRDLFLSHYDYFPLLGGFGEKDSGKSAFGKILQNFFYYRLPALDLTQATHVGFSRRLSRNTNTTQFLDEYQDKQCDDKIFSGMMGGWNGIGREKGMNTADKRTQYDKINSAIYYAGQFMPTRMENALATRTISLFFQNKSYTPEQKDQFNKLLNWTNSGISSLVVEIVQHRQYFENNLPTIHAQTVRELKEQLEGKDYQERIFGNVAMLCTTYHILKDKIEFPFTAAQVQKLCLKLITDNSEQIADSNGLTEFWNVLQFLFEAGYVKEELDFKVSRPLEFKIMAERRQEKVFKNETRGQILFLRLKSVYQHYNKEVTKREGVDVIGQTTLRQYFKSRKYFIGLVKGKRFGKAGTQSCYAFDYAAMQELNLCTLEEDTTPITAPDNSSVKIPEPEGNKDLPF